MEDGAWVWREVKARTPPPRSTADALRQFPQLALATLLLAQDVLPGKRDGARIELDWLTASSGDVLLIDPNDPAQVARARYCTHTRAQAPVRGRAAHCWTCCPRRPGPWLRRISTPTCCG